MAEEKTFLIRIITPDRIFYEGPAQMAEFCTTEGEIGVYPGHIPLTVILKPGVLTLTESGGKRRAALHTGFAEILPDRISILAEAAEWPGEIDISRAEAARKRAEERLAAHQADTDLARAETALQRAVARIETLR
ncbi:MAG: ATP synthase F1 subunit epsilon [Eubacteriales bacterium]|nr:ATP synthase F1 subunit epsilon [Eubacteriales bacterium]